MQLSDSDLLKFAVENGIIDMKAVQEQINMNERKKYLDGHKFRKWRGSGGKYYTYLPDKTSDSGRKQLKRSTLESLEDGIVDYYKAHENQPTFHEVFDAWGEQKLKYGEVKLQTAQRYKSDYLRFFANSRISNMEIRFINDDILEDFVKSTIHNENLTSKGWAKVRLILNGVFKYAAKRKYTEISITRFMGDLDLSRNIFRRRVKDPKKSVFTKAEEYMIQDLAYKANDVISLGVVLAFKTGLRAGELAALSWDCVTADCLRIRKMEIKYFGDDGKEVYEVVDSTKTEAGERDVIITDEARKTLMRLKRLNPFSKYVFVKDGKRVKANHFSRRLYRMCKTLHIEPRSLHKARKTYATNLLDAGIPESIIMQQMGHTSITTTKEFYYYNNRAVKDVSSMLEAAICPKGNQGNQNKKYSFNG